MSSMIRNATGSAPKGYQTGQLNNFSPEQMQLFQSMFSHVNPGSQLSKLASGDQSQFEAMEAPALRQFGALQGNIASRFSAGGGGPGASSSRRSSGFQNTMSSAASDFAQDLASKRMSFQQQAIRDLMGMGNDLLNQRPYENFLIPEEEEEPMWSKIAGIGLPMAGGVVGGIYGGPMGATAGASLGNSLASGLRGRQAPKTDWQGISSLPRKWGS